MSSEELAPSSLKNLRTERQNKYFKEQVLMKEETKIIAKTHKGESILTVDNTNNKDTHDDIFMSQDFVNKQTTDLNDKKSKDGSEKASWYYPSDGEEKLERDHINKDGTQLPLLQHNSSHKLSRESSSAKGGYQLHSQLSSKLNSLVGSTINNNNQHKGEFKYKNLSQDQIKFYFSLEEFNKDLLLKKFDEKLNSHLKAGTVAEIMKLRNSYNSNSKI
jgi:hypothetical protein